MLTLTGLLALTNFGDPFAAGQADPLMSENLIALYVRWDSWWYLSLIEGGYSPVEPEATQPGATNFAFFPVYPLLATAVRGLLGLSPATAGLLVANMAFLGALLLIFEYARLLGCSQRVGIIAVMLQCFIPHGFVFSAVYSESTYLLLLVAAMYALRRQHYWTAGLCAALLSATRANGIFFMVFAGAWLLRHQGLQLVLRPWRHPEPLAPIILAPLGLVAFWWFCFLTTGDAFAQASTALHGWGWHAGLPWRNLTAHLASADSNARFWALASLLVFALSLVLPRLAWHEEFLLCLSMLLLYWSGTLPSSLLRYSIVLFPIFLGLARVLDDRPFWFGLLLGACGILNGFLMTAWALQWPIAI